MSQNKGIVLWGERQVSRPSAIRSARVYIKHKHEQVHTQERVAETKTSINRSGWRLSQQSAVRIGRNYLHKKVSIASAQNSVEYKLRSFATVWSSIQCLFATHRFIITPKWAIARKNGGRVEISANGGGKSSGHYKKRNKERSTELRAAWFATY